MAPDARCAVRTPAMESQRGVDPKSGFCAANGIYYSKRGRCNLPPLQEDLDIPSFIFSPAEDFPGRDETAFLVDASTGARLSHREFKRSTEAVAAGLHALGIRKGDVVLVLSPNSIAIPCIYLGILSIGAVLTTANPLSTAAELRKQIGHSKPVLAFAAADLVPRVSAAAETLPIILITDAAGTDNNNNNNNNDFPCCVSTVGRLLQSDPAQAPSVSIKQQDVATLLYSSGTTGKSKGVVATHRNHIAIIQSRFTAVAAGRPWLCFIPMSHVFGLCVMFVLLKVGAPTVVMARFSARKLLSAIERYRVTFLPLAPPTLVALTKCAEAEKYDLTSLTHVSVGGAPAGKDVIQEFRRRFPFVRIKQSYGLTEVCGAASYVFTDEESERYGTAGPLSIVLEAKVVDIVSATHLPPNQRGELWLRGASVMKGYLKDKEATMTALDSEGWLRTGDLCYIDEEGYLFIVGRLKELIKYNAYQVAPAELEELLLNNPEISDAAVIPYPDQQAGQIPMACVVRKPHSQISAEDIMNFVAKEVAPYKRIRRVAFVNSVPRNSAGKILRDNLVLDIQTTSKI